MYIIIIAALTILIDQLSKYFIVNNLLPGQSIPIIRGFFHFTHTQNIGAAFGILPGRHLLFVIITIISIVLVLIYYFRFKERRIILQVALGLQVGGAVSNLIDRIFKGGVTDFIDFRWWPIFNLADVAIIIGAILLIYVFWKGERSAPSSI